MSAARWCTHLMLNLKIWLNFTFFVFQGRLNAPIKVKFGIDEYTLSSFTRTKLGSDQWKVVDMRGPKISKFHQVYQVYFFCLAGAIKFGMNEHNRGSLTRTKFGCDE